MFQHCTANRYDTTPDRTSRNFPQLSPVPMRSLLTSGALWRQSPRMRIHEGDWRTERFGSRHLPCVPDTAKVLLFPTLLLYHRLQDKELGPSSQVCLGVHPQPSMQTLQRALSSLITTFETVCLPTSPFLIVDQLGGVTQTHSSEGASSVAKRPPYAQPLQPTNTSDVSCVQASYHCKALECVQGGPQRPGRIRG